MRAEPRRHGADVARNYALRTIGNAEVDDDMDRASPSARPAQVRSARLLSSEIV